MTSAPLHVTSSHPKVTLSHLHVTSPHLHVTSPHLHATRFLLCAKQSSLNLPCRIVEESVLQQCRVTLGGFKTHVPGIFDKIQARLDSSVKLVDEETEEVSYCKPSKITTARFAEPRHAEKPEVVRGSKPASLSRSSSVLSSDDPIEIADQCLAEFQESIPNIPSPEAITPARDVLAASSVSPSRDVAKLRAHYYEPCC